MGLERTKAQAVLGLDAHHIDRKKEREEKEKKRSR